MLDTRYLLPMGHNNNNNNNNNGKVFMIAFKNLNALTCHNKIKYNDDTNIRLQN